MKHAPGFLKLVEAVMPRVKEISTEEVMALKKTGAPFALIDVREDHEFKAGHIEGASHMGRGIIERDIETKIPDKNTKLVLYCGGGFRSALSADNLQKMGYTNVFSMAGGWRNWRERGFPTS
jgi:rhodanese-related sulfurtransferase